MTAGFHLLKFLRETTKNECSHQVSALVITPKKQIVNKREESWIRHASPWNYIKSYGTMIGLGKGHICHRGLGKTRRVVTWCVASACLWRKCRHKTQRSRATDVLETVRTRELSVQQTTMNEAVISPTSWMVDWRNRTGEHERERRRWWLSLPAWRGRQKYLPTSALPPQVYYLFFLSTLIFISLCIQTQSFTRKVFFNTLNSSTFSSSEHYMTRYPLVCVQNQNRPVLLWVLLLQIQVRQLNWIQVE